jgi:hypothetical protein
MFSLQICPTSQELVYPVKSLIRIKWLDGSLVHSSYASIYKGVSG